jgi:hypothetical protein
MSAAAVSARWGAPVRPNYELRPTCGTARIERPGIAGEAIFMPRGRFGAVFFRSGAATGRGIRIGSTLAQLRRAYPKLRSRPDRYIHGGRNYFFASRTRPALGAARRREPGEARDADRVRRARVRTSRRRVRLRSVAHRGIRAASSSAGRRAVRGRGCRRSGRRRLWSPEARSRDPRVARRPWPQRRPPRPACSAPSATRRC